MFVRFVVLDIEKRKMQMNVRTIVKLTAVALEK